MVTHFSSFYRAGLWLSKIRESDEEASEILKVTNANLSGTIKQHNGKFNKFLPIILLWKW